MNKHLRITFSYFIQLYGIHGNTFVAYNYLEMIRYNFNLNIVIECAHFVLNVLFL